MNKKTKNMITKARKKGKYDINPLQYEIQKLSKRSCGIEYYDPISKNYVLELEGTPADIRKGIRYLERMTDVIPYYKNPPIMREGRIYSLLAYEGVWTVSRVSCEKKEEEVVCVTYDYDPEYREEEAEEMFIEF